MFCIFCRKEINDMDAHVVMINHKPGKACERCYNSFVSEQYHKFCEALLTKKGRKPK